jgi:uncharacterized membrane protein YbhN (UPF0104 family)
MAVKIENLKPSRGQLVFVIITLAALYLILPQIDVFRDGFRHLHNIEWRYLSLAIGCEIAANILAGTTYWLLTKHKLKFGRTVLVQLAGNFVNRLLPAGIGEIGINLAYLKANKHTTTQAASVIAVNNLLGAIGNIALLAYISFALKGVYDKLEIDKIHTDDSWRYVVGAIVIAVLIFAISKYRNKVLAGTISFIKQVAEYRRHPLKLVAAQSSSTLLTLSNVFCLYFSALALGVHMNPPTMLVIFSAGEAFGTATPTPGGLGGVDAALVVGLTAFGVPLTFSIAVTLLFRLISCWIPVIAGVGFLYLAEHRRYFNKYSH